MTPDQREIARNSVLLKSLPEPVANAVLAEARIRSSERGTTIFLQGEPATAIYVVLEGWVKLYRVTPSGGEAVVGVFTRGQSFGEAVALRDMDYPVAAESVTDCVLVRIEAATILRLIGDNPEIAVGIVSATFAHLHALVAQIEQLKAQTGAQRVAEFLLELAPRDSGACTVVLPYDKTLIAGRLGMKPESLSRAFARLREQGVTIRQNHAAIADVEALRSFVEQDSSAAWGQAL